MSLFISPPLLESSLWQTACEDHGPLIQAEPKNVCLLVGRLHDFNERELCRIYVGGLRCAYCFEFIEVERWPLRTTLCCSPCNERIRDRAHSPMDAPQSFVSFFARATPYG